MENTQPVPVQNVSMSGDASKNGKAKTAFVLGIISIVAWLLPIIGGPVAIVGIIFGILGRPSQLRSKATIGLTLSIIALVLAIGNAILGILLTLAVRPL